MANTVSGSMKWCMWMSCKHTLRKAGIEQDSQGCTDLQNSDEEIKGHVMPCELFDDKFDRRWAQHNVRLKIHGKESLRVFKCEPRSPTQKLEMSL